MIIVVLAALGLCFGSFVNALVWRLHQQSLPKKQRVAKDAKLSITQGRSMCPHCRHTLAWYDLLPVMSWLLLKGRCRYCHKAIGWHYPVVEASTAAVFLLSYIYWPFSLQTIAAKSLLVLWLVLVVGLMALLLYDLRWMLLPTRLIYALWPLAAVYVVIHSFSQPAATHAVLDVAFGAVVLGGLFWALFTISDKWIGGGDVRLGFLLGAIVGSPLLALLVLFIASTLGCLLALPLLASKRLALRSKLAFGPLLIIATFLVQLWGTGIIHWYTQRFLTF